MAAIIEQVGPCRMTQTEPTFESLARSIIYQQLHGKAAATIYGRLVAATSNPMLPESILLLSHEELRALGLSTQKAKYIRDLAERTARAEIDFAGMLNMADHEVIE